MNFVTYRMEASKTLIKNKNESTKDLIVRLTLGLTGEAGEVAEKVKKVLRDKKGRFSKEDRLALIDELGDCLWYLSNLSDLLGDRLPYVATRNITKLKSRKCRNTLKGSGDQR